MNSEEFVDAIKIVVRDSTASEMMAVLKQPPGRQPDPAIVGRSLWYRSLDEDQQRMVNSIIVDTVDRAVFGFLCVVDGVRAIENGPEKGRLELRYVKNDATVLNASDGPMLHDLW